jgi:resorcinol 4-hydroxylase (FADH2)
LRGTGSKTLRIDDACVPAHRIVAEADLRHGSGPGAAMHASPTYRMPLDAVFPIPLIGTAIGAASGAVSALADRLRGRGPAADSVTPAQVSGHLRLGHASARLDAALRLLSYNCRELVDHLSADRALSAAERTRYSLHYSMACEMCVDAVETAFLGAGGSSILDTDPFQRYWRDAHAAASHKAFNWDGFRALHGQQVASGAEVVSV